MINISIVIVSHNRLADLKSNLTCLLSDLPSDAEVIVVDNASVDGSREFLLESQQQLPGFKMILMDENKGVAIGRNTGFRIAQGDYIISLDDDATMSTEYINKVPAIFSTFNYAGILAF